MPGFAGGFDCEIKHKDIFITKTQRTQSPKRFGSGSVLPSSRDLLLFANFAKNFAHFALKKHLTAKAAK